jgi:hypothetical protein
MRLILLAAIVAVSLPTFAYAQHVHTRTRDCLRNTESGIAAPTSKQPGAQWLYIASLMKSAKPAKFTYGSAVSWRVAGSLKQACDAAISDFGKEPANKSWTITGAVVSLVPDSIIKQGSAH